MPYEGEDPPFAEPDRELDELAFRVIGAALEVHKYYGPGMDEALYEAAMEVELRRQEIPFESQVWIDVEYKGEIIGKRRIDLIVDGKLIVELKAVGELTPLNKAQVLTYLRLTRIKLGLLINFNVILLKDGIKRIINPM
jgi:GxxExxY protein